MSTKPVDVWKQLSLVQSKLEGVSHAGTQVPALDMILFTIFIHVLDDEMVNGVIKQAGNYEAGR